MQVMEPRPQPALERERAKRLRRLTHRFKSGLNHLGLGGADWTS